MVTIPSIHSVELSNFMCHSHLKLIFNKMITCIGGRNGSGKSAIMVALGIVFGQRVQKLERGSTLKELIKTGNNQAIIKVVINNYKKIKANKYGSRFIIEKKLRDGSTVTSIIGSKGIVHSAKKYDIELIIQTYGLKFDNPLNFLTQEQSKKFLNISDPSKLYDFYYQGTEFKNINEDLEQSKKILTENRSKILDAQINYEKYEKEVRICEEEIDFLNQDHELLLKELEREEKWFKIHEKLNKLKDFEENIDEYERKIYDAEKEKKLLEKPQKPSEEISTNDLSKTIAEIQMQYGLVEKDYSEFIKEIEGKKVELMKIKAKNKLEELNISLKNSNAEFQNFNIKKEKLEKEKIQLENLSIKESILNEEKFNKKSAFRKQIEYLNQNSVDEQTKKHLQNFEKIDAEIKKVKLKDEIIGPLCNVIKLKDQIWFKPLSIILKGSLFSFIVFNKFDKIALSNIFNKIGANYMISQLSSKVPITNYSRIPGYKTVLDVIELKYPIVINHLIIFNNIDQIILFENREDAYKAVKSQIKNVDSAYTIEGDRVKLVNGSLSDYHPKDYGKYWFEDKISKIKNLELEMKKLEINYEYKDKLKNLNQELSILEGNIQPALRKIRELNNEIESFKNMKENDDSEIEKHIFTLESQVKKLKSKLKDLENKLTESRQEKEEIENQNRKSKLEFSKKTNENLARISKLDCELSILERNKGNLISKKRELREEIDENVKDLGDQIERPRNLEQIAREKRELKEKIQIAKRMQSKENLIQSLKSSKKQKRYFETLLKRHEKSVMKAEEAFKIRLEKRDKMKDKTTIEASNMFREYTLKNNYDGELVFDHENRTLDLRMRVHNAEYAGSKNTLSGGERSFAGICFLISMWKSFLCPIKVLDEFDVFMDTINRKIAIKALIEFFKMNSIQAILITPLNTSDLLCDDCEILMVSKNE